MSMWKEEKMILQYSADEILQLKDCFYAQQRPINLPEWFQAENEGSRMETNGTQPNPICRRGTTYYPQPPPMVRSFPTQLIAKPRPIFRRSDYDLPFMNMNEGFRAVRPPAVRPGRSFHQRRVQPWNTPPTAPTAGVFPPQLPYLVLFGETHDAVVTDAPSFFY